MTAIPINKVEESVRQRYSQAAQAVEASLCCAVAYDKDLLKIIPSEIIERDYGCGDPSPFIRPGDTVVDLGSGAGKLCYIAAQIVGAKGHVIGVDWNQDMLALASGLAVSERETASRDHDAFTTGQIVSTQPDATDQAT